MPQFNFNLTENRYQKILELLQGIKNHLEEQEILQKEILDFSEACRYLKVSDSFLYKKTSAGEIPFSKPNGGKLYFKKNDLDEWRLREPIKSEKVLIEEAREWLNENFNEKAA